MSRAKRNTSPMEATGSVNALALSERSTSDRRKDRSLYARAKKKRDAGKTLSYAERQRLDLARERRVHREETTALLDWKREQNVKAGLRFAHTKFGWAVVIPNDVPGGPWSSRDEIEVPKRSGEPQWVTLVSLKFTGGDERRSQWWSFIAGRQSQVTKYIPPPVVDPRGSPDDKAAACLLDEEDEDRVSTGAGAAYLAARRKR